MSLGMMSLTTNDALAETPTSWSHEEFEQADFGDKRLTKRLISMASRAAEKPAGRITEVFGDGAERQAAYDFVSNPRVSAEAMLSSMASAMTGRCQGDSFIFVPVDGTTLSLTDRALSKDFGSIGGGNNKGRGVKVITAMGVDPTGIPLGVVAITYWVCTSKPKKDKRKRTTEEKELKHSLSIFQQTTERLEASGQSTRAWFQYDRGGDARPFLQHCSTNGHFFTFRSSWNRRVHGTGPKQRYLRDVLEELEPLGMYSLEVTEGPGRSARIARMSVRATKVTLDLQDKCTGKRTPLETNVVWVREESEVPEGQKPLEWILLTNYSIEHLEDVCLVVYGYTQRWRIEEFHRTWKKGSCNVESTQLRTTEHVKRWATLLAAVAMRIERLKYLSRNHPELPATEELSPYEIKALMLLKRRNKKKKTETIPDGIPTIGQATGWIADLGGYTGKSSGGPPGAVTIRRGLERVVVVANAMKELEEEGLLTMR